MTPNFSLVIPNLNGQKYLAECLPSLTASLAKIQSKSKIEIILVDNASTDQSVADFKNHLKNFDLKIIQNSTNLGFAPAVNQGIRTAKHSWVVLVNNDLIVDQDWFNKISNAIEKFDQPSLVSVSGTVLNKPGTHYESTGLLFDQIGKCLNRDNNRLFEPKKLKSEPEFIWGASAALIAYKKKVLKQVGLFDEDFFAYEEDVDLALRLSNLGYKTLYIPQATCRHLGGGTSNKMGNFRNRMDLKNWIYIVIKNYPLELILKKFPQIIVERLRNVSGLLKSTFHQQGIRSIIAAPPSLLSVTMEILVHLPSMLAKRKKYKALALMIKSKHVR